MRPRSDTESYPAFAHIGLRENPGKNLSQVTCPDRESNPGHLVSRPDALAVTPQVVVITEDVQNVHLLLEYRPHIDLRTRSQSPGVLRMSSEHATIRFRRDSISGTGDE
ncbi:hypothetical protein ANN_26673 [Periplaneta americana]|uniref:Uncharacterized protein n=1 Tax=Periplaneta americana TaxID=6978 RepID=A0ABQ8RZ01_PERAM|nr:hypothetical protein ANN_26673 [Periplaneta americana]